MKFGRGLYDTKKISLLNPFFRSDRKREVLLGLPQWNVPAWKKDFYKADCTQAHFLKQYSERLDCVEVSSTFYADVAENTLRKWCESVEGNDLEFLPKWPQNITHLRSLKNCRNEKNRFINSMMILGERLGTTLLQLPPTFSKDYSRELYFFIKDLPQEFPLCVEFRHSSWFKNGQLYNKLRDYFYVNDIGSVCLDTPARSDVFSLSFTGKQNVIRFLSDEVDQNDQLRLSNWRSFFEKSIPESSGGKFYFIIHRPDNDHAPKLIADFSPDKAEFIETLNIGPQTSLFS